MRKVRWGVLGTARIAASDTIPGIRNSSNGELYAIAGRSLEKAEQFREKFGFQKAYGTYAELLEDPEVEAVYIPLPNHLHKEWVIKAAKAGKHVLCEKPMAASAEDAREMIQACNDAGVIFMEAFAYLHSPAVKKVKEQVDAGLIGDVNMIESKFHTGGYEEDIRIHRATLGGAMYDLGCYCTSFMTYLYGDAPVSGMGVSTLTDEKIDDMTTGYLIYPGDRRGILSCAMFPNQRGDGEILYGTKGKLEIPFEFNQKGLLKWYLVQNGVRTEFSEEVPCNYRLEVEQMGRCILEGEKPLVSNQFSLENAAAMDFILKSNGYWD